MIPGTASGAPGPPRPGQKGSGNARSPEFAAETPNRLAIMRLETKIPDTSWLGPFTRRHPNLVIECLSIVALPGDEFLGEYEIFGPPEDWTSEISTSPNVVDAQNLKALSNVGRYQVRFRQVVVAALAAHLAIIVRYPRTIENGILKVEVIATVRKIRRLVQALTEAGNEPRLVSLRRDALRSEPVLLTPVQRVLFRQALALGYYEVPRRITLTGLAQQVSRSKSTVSRTLALVDKKLAKFASATGA